MKINITIEATPEELREAMGLPDLKLFHAEALDDVQKRLKTIQDPRELMKVILPVSGAIGKTFWEEMAKNMSLLRIDLPTSGDKKEEKAKEKNEIKEEKTEKTPPAKKISHAPKEAKPEKTAKKPEKKEA